MNLTERLQITESRRPLSGVTRCQRQLDDIDEWILAEVERSIRRRALRIQILEACLYLAKVLVLGAFAFGCLYMLIPR